MPLTKKLKALQGLWTEEVKQGRNPKSWLVEEDIAYEQLESGKRGKKFHLKSDSDGYVVWGNGTYVLDASILYDNSCAVWNPNDGRSKGFTWLRQGGGKGQAVKAEAEEKRIDPSDGKAYSLDEMMTFYAETYGTPKIETHSYWLECKAKGSGKGAGEAKPQPDAPEKRIDPADGKAYSREELGVFYAQEYSKKALNAYWDQCEVKAPKKATPKADKGGKSSGKGKTSAGEGSEPEKRVDPVDGKAYTWEELRAHYSATYTKKVTEKYWEDCMEVPKAKAKDKGKGKGKTKGKGKPK